MENSKRIGIFLAAILIGAIGSIGCSRGSDTLVFTSEGEFRENLAEAEKLSRPVFEKADRGESIEPAEKEDLIGAIRIFNGLYAYKRNLFTMPFAIGKCYQILGDDQLAIQFYTEAAALLEGRSDELSKSTLAETNYLAVGSLIRLGQTESALDAAKRAVAYNPNSANYHAALASAYIQLKQEDKAEETLKKALSIDPENVFAMRLARLYAWGKATR